MANDLLPKKLLIRPGQRIVFINPPSGYLDSLGELPSGVELVDKPGTPVDFVQVFVGNKHELERLVPGALKALKDEGVFWVCYPKGGTKAKTNLNRDILWEAMKKFDLAGVSLVSIDNVWSAMRFRP